MTIHPQVFREYDIRGVVGQDLDAVVVEAVGRAYAADLVDALEAGGDESPRPRVVVGRDNRPTSPELCDALMRGLEDGGLDVLDLGVVPTPVVWWAEKTLEVDGALQLTGSHNPAGWNGIKMTRLGRSLYGSDIQGLRVRIEEGEFAGTPPGRRREVPVLDRYVEDLSGRFRLARPVRMAVDCGNGTGSVVAVRLLEAIGIEVCPLFCESDGTFPNHHPDPTVDANLVDLQALVTESEAELGVSFDGDADRIGAVDNAGRIVRGDVLLLLLGLDLLEREGPDQLLIFDVKSSQVVPEVFEAAGGSTLMWKTGHSLMKEKMWETGAPIAGELSGHLYFGGEEYLGIDDALYAACRLAEMISRSSRTLEAMVEEFPRYESTPEIRIEVDEADKAIIVEGAVAHFSQAHDVVDVDGIRILFGDGWGLVRASNTQPVIVTRFEARTPKRLEEIRSEVEDWLRSKGVDV